MFSIKKSARALLGSGGAREYHCKQLAISKNDIETFEVLKKYTPASMSDDKLAPVFILSAGWRSGSTLLQRLVSSSGEIFMWGEPFDKSNIIAFLAGTLRPFSRDWPPESFFHDDKSITDLSKSWVANLYPQVGQLIDAHRAFLLKLFADPIIDEKIKRWGIKEVRFGLREALYLKTIFPHARFLYLYRDLYAAYTSYTNFSQTMNWYSTWPTGKAFTPYAFAKHRAKLLKEFEIAINYTGGQMIDFADLTSQNIDYNALNDYCGIVVNESVLESKIGSGFENNKSHRKQYLSSFERLLLNIGHKSNRFSA